MIENKTKYTRALNPKHYTVKPIFTQKVYKHRRSPDYRVLPISRATTPNAGTSIVGTGFLGSPVGP